MLFCLQACADRLDQELRDYGVPPKFPEPEEVPPEVPVAATAVSHLSTCLCIARSLNSVGLQMPHAACSKEMWYGGPNFADNVVML